jgi:hypothetical protein
VVPLPASAGRPGRRVVLRVAVLGPLSLLAAGCAGGPPVQVTGDSPADQVVAYREHAERAVELVEGLWGEGTVALPVRLDLPADVVRWAAATGHPQAETGIPASTVSRGDTRTIVVHPGAWARLTEQGRQAVLTHEVTHLAQPSGRVPWWLQEGSAEFTAHRLSSSSPSGIAGAEWAALVADPPTRWPEPAAGEGAGRWSSYAAAWSTCLAVAEQHGEGAVPRWHRAVAETASLEAGSVAALGRSSAELLRSWSAWLGAQSL